MSGVNTPKQTGIDDDFDNTTSVFSDKALSDRMLNEARLASMAYDLFERLSTGTKRGVERIVPGTGNVKRSSDTI